jgi:hypothetical protein
MREVIVTMNHVRSCRMCAREARTWAKSRGMNWTEFITNGLPEHTLTETGDPMALKVVEFARNDPDARWIDVE